jgi:hypothetical protein
MVEWNPVETVKILIVQIGTNNGLQTERATMRFGDG